MSASNLRENQPTPWDEPNAAPAGGDTTLAPPKKRRRRWPWVILGIVLLLILLVVLAPTIASTGPVRSLVVGQINKNVNGTVQIADWSLGWTSGIDVGGVKVFDENKMDILEI